MTRERAGTRASMLRDRVQQRRIIGHWSRDNSHRPPVKKFPRSIVEKFAALTVAFPGDCRAVALHGEKEERSRGRYEKQTFQGKTHILFRATGKFLLRILADLSNRSYRTVQATTNGINDASV